MTTATIVARLASTRKCVRDHVLKRDVPRIELCYNRRMKERETSVDKRDAWEQFIADYPAYEDTTVLDDLRRREFSRLDRHRHVYLDYTGGGLYGECQVRDHADLLVDSVLGNPHSTNPSSLLATDLVDRCRRRILRFFNASPDEYTVIFTSNATAALKLVGESYPFEPESTYLLIFDNHNSVNGLREFCRARKAKTRYVPVAPPDLRVPDAFLDRYVDDEYLVVRGRQFT